MKGFNEGDTLNRELVRHMSIATVPDEGLIGVTTRIKTVCSTYKETLKHLSVGDDVALFKTGLIYRLEEKIRLCVYYHQALAL